MTWIEVIQLRSVDIDRKLLEAKLQALANDVNKTPEKWSLMVYHREMIDTDICLVLSHSGEKEKIGGSRLGLRLVAALKEFGLVNHSIWLERK